MNEIIFLVEEAAEGGYTASALRESIVTQAETMPELKKMVKDAVKCHFDGSEKSKMPKLIRLHFVKEEVFAIWKLSDNTNMSQTHTLHLTLKKQWFDMIAGGKKKEEYRECKDYWSIRLIEQATGKFKKYGVVRFRNGYARNAPSMDIACKKISLGFSKTKWSNKPPVKCFVITLGEILTIRNSALLT